MVTITQRTMRTMVVRTKSITEYILKLTLETKESGMVHTVKTIFDIAFIKTNMPTTSIPSDRTRWMNSAIVYNGFTPLYYCEVPRYFVRSHRILRLHALVNLDSYEILDANTLNFAVDTLLGDDLWHLKTQCWPQSDGPLFTKRRDV